MKHFVLLLCALLACAACFTNEPEEKDHLVWLTDLDEGMKKAEKENKLLLVNFTGSDWCYWCIRLEGEVFSKSEFQQYVKDHFVLVMLDFPRKKLPEEQSRKNKEWAKKYQIKGYPTVLVLDAKGNIVAKTGYRQGGPENYVKHLQEIVANYQQSQKAEKQSR